MSSNWFQDASSASGKASAGTGSSKPKTPGTIPPGFAYDRTNQGASVDWAVKSNLAERHKWNAAARDYNKQVGALDKQYGSIFDRLGTQSQWDYTSLWDDPTTKRNEDVSRHVSDLEALLASLGKIQSPGTGPDYKASVSGSWGKAAVPELNPDLFVAELARDRYDALKNNATSWLDYLTGLQSERKTRLDTLNKAGLGLEEGLTGLKRQLQDTGFRDRDMLKQMRSDLDSLYFDRKGYNDDGLLSQGFTGFDDADRLYAQLDKALSGKDDRYGAWQDKVQNRQKNFASQIDTLKSRLGELSWQDQDELARADRQIDNLRTRISGFNPGEGYDPSVFGAGLSQLEDILARKTGRREDARSEVLNKQQAYGTKAKDLLDEIINGSAYDATDLADWQHQFKSLKSGVRGYEAPIGKANFRDATSRFGDIRDALQDVTKRHNSALKGFEKDYGKLDGLDDLRAYDTDALQEYQDSLSDIQSRMDPYSGGRAKDLAARLEADQDLIARKLRSGGKHRSKLEDEAAALREKLEGEDFYGMDTVDKRRGRYDDLMERVKRWGATGSNADMTAMDTLLNKQRNRLQQEGEIVTGREDAARRRISEALLTRQLGNPVNVGTIDGLSAFMGPNGLVDYDALLDDEKSTQSLIDMVFSRGLGLV